jgi:tetratricopeptide (TPR) repeat protein
MSGEATAQPLDRFLVREAAGSGAMGLVHRAIDRRTGDTVALKRMIGDSPDLLTRFTIERQALAALDHPGIVRLVAHGQASDGRPFLAMEWLDGEDLAAQLARGCLTPLEVATLGASTASALSAAHDRGIVHRDIKPANLFLLGGRKDRVKVLDFGIASMAGSSVTATGTLLGTPSYIAPEQARASKTADARADLFSLGAVMFECLTGSPPFSGEHVMAVLAKVLLEEAPPVSELCPEAPEALATFVDHLLAKEPGARPRSAAEVAAALERLAAEIATSVAPEPEAPRTPRRAPALVVRERRFITVVAIDSDTVLAGDTDLLGGRMDRLANGTQLVTWMGEEDPAERTARAARFALLVRGAASSSSIAVATGLSDTVEARPIGQALDRAASLLPRDGAPASPGVWLDAVAAGLLDPRFQIARQPEGFELLGEDEISKGARILLGRPSPFAGRERELRLLVDLVDECARERAPRAVLVTAPAGAGKSRLAHELRRALAARCEDLDVWLGRGDCMSAGSAFATVGYALRNTAGIRLGDPLSERQRRLEDRVARQVPEPERVRVTGFLGELAGVPFPDSYCALLEPARRSAATMAERIRSAWEDFVAAECAARPVLLVLDDLHWGDTPTVNLIDATLGALQHSPLFVLALGRPDTHDMFPALWARRDLQQVRLGGLSTRAADELVRAMLGDSVDRALTAQIIERAGGNALYLEEMIRAAAEGGLGELPDTVLAMIQARLDALPAEERAVLRAATVFGEVFCVPGVEALLEDTGLAGRAAACLKALVSREILVPSASRRYFGERELAFRHALLRDGAYTLLAETDRVAMHRRAGAWLEEMGEEDAVLLAEHFEHGAVPERAIQHRFAAAQRALIGNDLRAAIAHAERVAPDDDDTALVIRRAHLLNESYWIMGNSERATLNSRVLVERAPVGSEPWCNAIAIQMLLALERGSIDDLNSTIERFMGAPIADQRSEWIARVYTIIVLALCTTGLQGPTAYFLEMAEKTAAVDPPDLTTQWFLYTARAQRYFFLHGDLLAAMTEYHSALACCEQSGKRQFDAFNHGLLSWVYSMLGAEDRAANHARQAIATSHVGAQADLVGRITLAWLSTIRGATEEAVAFAKGALEAAPNDSYMAGMAQVAWGYALSSAGRWSEVEPHTNEALRLLAGTPALHALAQVQQCDLRRVQGRPAEALRGLSTILTGDGSFVVHPMALAYARMVRIQVLDALGDMRVLDAALIEERARILATAARIDDPSLRASFLEVPPWNTVILARAAERLHGRPGTDKSAASLGGITAA